MQCPSALHVFEQLKFLVYLPPVIYQNIPADLGKQQWVCRLPSLSAGRLGTAMFATSNRFKLLSLCCAVVGT